MKELLTVIEETITAMAGTMSGAAPKILATLLVVVAGLLVARTGKFALHRLLSAIRFDDIAGRSGISAALQRADIQQSASGILCTLAYWVLLTFTGLVALGTLGIADASTFAEIGAMVPKVVIAIAILVLGINVSAFLAKLIQMTAVNAEVRQARLMRNVAYYAMCALVAILALQQLGISGELLGTGFLIFFGAASLAMALAFGLGARAWAGELVTRTYKSEQEQHRTLSAASELGNHIIPDITTGKKRRRRAAA